MRQTIGAPAGGQASPNLGEEARRSTEAGGWGTWPGEGGRTQPARDEPWRARAGTAAPRAGARVETGAAGILSLAVRAIVKDKQAHRRGNQHSERDKLSERVDIMGDKSPKSVQKQASQKQSKADVENKKKQAVVLSQQAAKAKAAANKKK